MIDIDTNLKFNKQIQKDDILNNYLINDIFYKCKKYKNSIFETYDKYNYDTVYAIGDIHGDYDALIKILNKINCIIKEKNNEFEYKWNPKIKNTCIVQVGDIMGGYHDFSHKHVISKTYIPKEIKIIKFLLKLSEEALQYNSRIILLYGNHEIDVFFSMIDKIKMNTINDKKNIIFKDFSKIKEEILCNYHSVCIVNSYLFCHAGIILKIIQKLMFLFNIDKEQFIELKQSDKLFLINVCVVGLLNSLLTNKIKKDNIENIKQNIYNIFNNREYSKFRLIDQKLKENLTNTIKLSINKHILETKQLYNIKGIIIGHNKTSDFVIHKYNDVYDIDVKISEGFGTDIKNEYNQILKIIRNNKPEVINVLNK